MFFLLLPLLVLNADDPLLLQRQTIDATQVRTAWFALDFDHPQLRRQRDQDGMTCGVRDGLLMLSMPPDAQTAASGHDPGANELRVHDPTRRS